jgi:hypothetical protein
MTPMFSTSDDFVQDGSRKKPRFPPGTEELNSQLCTD